MNRVLMAIVIVTGMLISGAGNTLLNKLQDRVCVSDCSSPTDDGKVFFSQPVWQTWVMFIGELLCLVVYLVSPYLQPASASKQAEIVISDEEEQELLNSNRSGEPAIRRTPLTGWGLLKFAIPAMCDITATTLLNVGLMAVSASIYQMLRGIVVIFTAGCSVFFLKKKLSRGRIFGLGMVLGGVTLVGASPVLFPSDNNSKTTSGFVGILLILLAQFIAAFQFTYEEILMTKHDISPLRLVGMEGFFGSIIVSFVILILSLTSASGYLDVKAGASQIVGSNAILGSMVGAAICVAFFNFFGLNITRYVSATSRSTVDTCRTLLIWLISLGLHWERFIWLQVVGFVLLIYGTFVFNQIVSVLLCFGSKSSSNNDTEDVDPNHADEVDEEYQTRPDSTKNVIAQE